MVNQALMATSSLQGATEMRGALCWAHWEPQLLCSHPGLTRSN